MSWFSVNAGEGKNNHHEIPCEPKKVIGADMFTLHNRNYNCIVDYHHSFPIIKMIEDLSADSVILACKIIFSEYGLLKKIMSDIGSNFISDKFKRFCPNLNIDQAVSSSNHHRAMDR